MLRVYLMPMEDDNEAPGGKVAAAGIPCSVWGSVTDEPPELGWNGDTVVSQAQPGAGAWGWKQVGLLAVPL